MLRAIVRDIQRNSLEQIEDGNSICLWFLSDKIRFKGLSFQKDFFLSIQIWKIKKPQIFRLHIWICKSVLLSIFLIHMNVMINNMVPMSLWATAKAQPWNRIMQGHGIGILNKDPRSNYMQYDIHQHLLTGIGVHIYVPT